MRPITLVSLLVIVGCDQVSWLGAKPIQVEPSVPTPDSCEDAPQFATVAEPILVQWCVGCHTSQFEGSDRSGAPTGIDFDTYQGAFANAAAIDRVAGGLDGSTMPPAGGITDEERALLREWVSCGAQGEPEPVGLCDTQKWYFGSVLLVEGESLPDNWCDQYNSIGGGLFVRDGGDVSGIADCICEVDGQFMLQGAVGDELNFAELQTITGAIEITALHTDETVAAQLPQDIRLPKLTRAGSLTVVDHPALKSLYAPALSELFKPGVGLVVQRAAGDIDIHDLRTIAGPVDVQDNPGLTSIEFDQVFLVDGSFTLVGNDSLSWVDTRAVDAVNGAINVSDNAMLNWDLPFRELADVGGGITIRNNASMTSISGFNWVEQVPGDVLFEDLPMVAAIDNFPLVNEVQGDLSITGLPELVHLSAFVGLTEIEGSLRLRDLAKLNYYLGFFLLERVGGSFDVDTTALYGVGAPNLGHVGALAITNNNQLFFVTGLAGIEVVDETIYISGQPQLGSLVGLAGIRWVGGSLWIDGNAALSDVSHLEGINGVGGNVAITNNPNLSQMSIAELLVAIGYEDIDGDLTIEDNGS